TKRWEEGFRRSANPHIEGAAGAFAFEKRKVRLLRLFSKPSITKVGHNTDDFSIRHSVRSRTLTDSHPQRTPPSQVALRECLVHDGRAPAWFARCARVTFIEVSSRND